MRIPAAPIVAAIAIAVLFALPGCASTAEDRTAGTGTTADTGSGTTSTDIASDLPAENEPLANGIPVMYEFYSDT